ncbi:hypothetical protein BN970_02147 [Mycolicibacterium conceptionense]|uniref:Helix-turn-helix domain-containing protein n=1 Tax=Mycolicibacterium conceptionense TaxID=451644 RepID=A0A0U1D9F1_9MYCO|nr:hypothetical protein [Mycolicibacterium conceptionense]CQD10791.1 hypothetical protein BN970_02147 [Mycolicibacterium conceptionense]
MNDWKATSAKLGGISRTMVFQLWASGTLASCRIGKRRFSSDQQIDAFIAKLEGAAVMHPNVDQLARDQLDDHNLVDREPAGDDETAPEIPVRQHRAGAVRPTQFSHESR